MQLHQLKSKNKSKKRIRIGRGGKRGTYSGKGNKGQRSRAGRKFQPAIRELIKKFPKLRGYRFRNRLSNIVALNIDDITKRFEVGETVSPKSLLEKRLIRRIKGKMPVVKILGEGKIERKLIIEDCQVSNSAKEKIEKAGGEVKMSKS